MNKMSRQCTCWAGYKRVPGTKPCSKKSCVKSVRKNTSLSKKRSNKSRHMKKQWNRSK